MKLTKLERLADFFNDGHQHCNQALYGPCRIFEGSIYGQGGMLDLAHAPSDPLGSPLRQADRIYQVVPGQKPRVVIDRFIFPWMGNGEEWLQAHPESLVGSCNSPSVVKLAPDHYIMAFTASINDANVHAGEHTPDDLIDPGGRNVYDFALQRQGDGTLQYERAVPPWSFFAVYFATSPNGTDWSLVEPLQREPVCFDDPSRWMALNAAALWYYPRPENRDASKIGSIGISSVQMRLDSDDYLYLLLIFWPEGSCKSLVVRTLVDYSAAAGHNFNFEIADTKDWSWEVVRGRLPEWCNSEPWRGVIFGSIPNQIIPSSLFSPYRYLATVLTPDLGVAHSMDGLHWTPPELIGGVPAGMPIVNPIWFEDTRGAHVLLASPGVPPCSPDPFVGMSLWQADVEMD